MSRTMWKVMLALAALQLSAAALCALPKLTYVVRVLPERAEWRVLVAGEGLDSVPGAGIYLPNWGEWLKLGSRVLTSFRSDPPAVPLPGQPGRFKLKPPRGWDGKLRVVYTLRPALIGSRELAQAPLVVRRHDDFQLGFARGTLLGLSEDIYEQPAERTLILMPPRGWVSTTGFGPAREGVMRVAMDPKYYNGVIATARAVRFARGTAVDTPIEVAQLGAGPRATEGVRDAVASAWTRLCHDVGDVPLPRVGVVVLPVPSWSTFTPHGIHVGLDLDHAVLPGGGLEPGSERTVVHELAHAWNGFALSRAVGMEWFGEGFTEYLALRTMVGAGLEDRAWFGRMMMNRRLETEGNRLAAKVAFLGEARDWRADDEIETLIYSKAPLVAFALDVALRRRGHPGVPRMIGDLIREGRELDAAALRRWLDAHGMQEFTARHLAGAALPDTVADLTAVGIRVVRAPVSLAYTGLRLESGTGLTGRVAELDPAGPAARAGVKPGDTIYGVTPLRPVTAQLLAVTPTNYNFGLRSLEPERPARLRLETKGGTRAVTLTPRALPGVELRYTDHSSTIPYFFINR